MNLWIVISFIIVINMSLCLAEFLELFCNYAELLRVNQRTKLKHHLLEKWSKKPKQGREEYSCKSSREWASQHPKEPISSMLWPVLHKHPSLTYSLVLRKQQIWVAFSPKLPENIHAMFPGSLLVVNSSQSCLLIVKLYMEYKGECSPVPWEMGKARPFV